MKLNYFLSCLIKVFKMNFKLFNKLIVYTVLLIVLLAMTVLFPVNYLFEQSKKNIVTAEVKLANNFFKENIRSRDTSSIELINSFLPYSIDNIIFCDHDGTTFSVRTLSKELRKEVNIVNQLYHSESDVTTMFTENDFHFLYLIKDEVTLSNVIYTIPKDDFTSEFNAFKKQMYFVVISVSLFLILLSLVFFNRVLSPIKLLQGMTKKIVSGKYVNSDIVTKSDEVGEVINNVSRISEVLQTKKKFLNNYNKLLQKKFTELEHKKREVEYQNEQIESGLRYAKQIQTELLRNYNTNYEGDLYSWFPIIKPFGIVSGDFYNVTLISIDGVKHTFFSVADCTGHGVQAALLTVMANDALNAILQQKKTANVASVLVELNRRFVASFGEKSSQGKIDSGLDIAIVALNHMTKELTFAGAYRPCVIKRGEEIIQLKANRISLGYLPCDLINLKIRKRASFKTQKIQLLENDEIFMFSDGVTDQFDSQNESKYGIKRLITILSNLNKEVFFEVKETILDDLKKWQGKSSQTDDQLLLGIRIK